MAAAGGAWVKGTFKPASGTTKKWTRGAIGGRNREFASAQSALIAEKRKYRQSQSAYRRIQSALDVLADARWFDALQNPKGSREEYYSRAQSVLDAISANGAGSIGFGRTYNRVSG